MNQTTIAGHLGADPEVRFTSSGKKVTTLRVAARVRRSSKDETIWWRVSIWGEEFDKIIPYFKKGSPIIAMGELNKPEIFTDREGKPQISMSMTAFHISFSPFGKPEAAGSHSTAETASADSFGDMTGSMAAPMAAYGQGRSTPSFSDDEIPF